MNFIRKKLEETQRDRVIRLYNDILTALAHAPTLDKCTEEESEMYASAFELKERIKEAGYSKKEI